MHNITEGIAENLNLDMSWPFHKPLGIQSPVAEIALPFAPRLRHRIVKTGEVANDSHTLTATSCRWLDEKGRADSAGTVKKRVGIIFLDSRWRDWKSVARDKITRPDLIPHQLDHVSGRTDKNKSSGLDRAGEDRIFGEKTIAGVNRTGGDGQGRGDDLIAIQIGRNGGSTGDPNRVIRERYRGRLGIDLMIDNRALQPELLQCPNDANGDFAAIGDENHTKRKRTDHRAPQMPDVSMIVRSRAVCVTRSWPLPLT